MSGPHTIHNLDWLQVILLLLESGGLQIDTRPNYDMGKTRNMYDGESTQMEIDIDTSGELLWIFVSRGEQ